jgi:hypothetical protein
MSIESTPEPKRMRVELALDPILSQIMRALAMAKKGEAGIYLEKAAWLYENVDARFFSEESREAGSETAADSAEIPRGSSGFPTNIRRAVSLP